MTEPRVIIALYLVGHGYQADVLENLSDDDNPDLGWEISSECRDFGGSYPVNDLTAEFKRRFLSLMDEFRSGK